MPKMPEPGKQIKVWLPQHILDALGQEAKDSGEKRVQSIVRIILGRHYRGQVREVGPDAVELQGTG